MDLKDFKDGLTSLSLVIFSFSLTFLIGSISLQPYIGLKSADRDYIVILCAINIGFSFFYLYEALQIDKVFHLEDHHVERFGRRIAIVTFFYIPHFVLVISLLFLGLHELQVLMVYLIIFMELCLIGTILKEAYDLVLLNESDRKFELEMNRKRYVQGYDDRDKRDKPIEPIF